MFDMFIYIDTIYTDIENYKNYKDGIKHEGCSWLGAS